MAPVRGRRTEASRGRNGWSRRTIAAPPTRRTAEPWPEACALATGRAGQRRTEPVLASLADRPTEGRTMELDDVLFLPARLAAVRGAGLVGTPAEAAFDRITRLA